MTISRHTTLITMAALLGVATLIGCGTGRTASGNKTIVAENRPNDKETSTPSADTCLNTKLRLRYFYEEAAKQQALGNYDDAYMLLLHCKRIDPNAAEVHYALSNYDESLNSKEMAIADIKRAAELNPDNNTYLERLAMTYISTKDYDNAIKSYEKLYAANPDRTEVLEILLKLYNEKKNYSKMINTMERMELADGESEKTVLTKMHIYSMQGKTKEEYNTLRKFVDRYPNDLSYQVMTANWLLQHDKKKQALSILEKVLKEEPENELAKLSMVDYYRAEKLDSIANITEEQLLVSPQTATDTKV
ncbi:MAG: tetratricopeptide repeat protein, partial [Prevotella pectinovora]